MSRTKFYMLMSGLFMSLTLNAWAFEHGTFNYKVQGQTTLSTGENTPFWLSTNNYGLSSIRKSNGYLRAGVFADLDTTNRRFKWSAGVDLVVPYRYTSHFVVQQLYVDLRYRCLGLLIGSKELSNGIIDRSLSSGDLLESSNARPVPQVRFGLPEYTNIPGTKRWLAVKGHIAFGRFTDDNWIDNYAPVGNHPYTTGVLYHSKSILLRVSNLNDRNWMFEGGLEMAAQFGGKLHYTDGKVVSMPHSVKDYIRAILALSGGSDAPTSDQANVLGNHLGNWIAAVTYKPTSYWTLKAYYQHFFEDHSMMFFDYPWRDGMIGLQITPPRNPVVSKFVYEYLYTKFQSGSVYWDHNDAIGSQISGTDNYYNHGLYNSWQHWGLAMGNPLLISPIYNKDGKLDFRSNRIIANHFGLEGVPCSWLSYRLLFSYTQSWGTYGKPYTDIKSNLNTMLELTAPVGRIPGFKVSIAGAIDRGNLIGHSAGAMITLTKTGLF